MTNATPCSIDGCERPVLARGWCPGHYGRWLKNGTPGTTPIRERGPLGSGEKRPSPGPCAVELCEEPAHARGWCKPHYLRWWRTGDAGGLDFISYPLDPRDLSYNAAHRRVGVARGPARKHECPCGKRASQWAYQYNDPDVLVDDRGYLYSANVDCYAPMCITCHKALDISQREKAERVFALAPGGGLY